MENNSKNRYVKNHRRTYGEHLTSTDIFQEFILPEIKGDLNNHIWIDLYAGEGNLILPILDCIPVKNRINFFSKHIFLFDIQPEMVEICISNAQNYGIPKNLARKNILIRNSLESFPAFLLEKDLPIYHITNPPYLYLGYIRKHEETQKYLKLFEDDNQGYQDLYQIAMINDHRNGIKNLIYIIPSNFLFGASVSNKFRLDFLKYYSILKTVIFEIKIFEHTGTNTSIVFFKRKEMPKVEIQRFYGLKIKKKSKIIEKSYEIDPKYKYRAGSEFDKFLEEYRSSNPLIVNYYLLSNEVKKNQGPFEIEVIDANNYENAEYKRLKIKVNRRLKEKIENNALYIRTVDTGSLEGRAGIGIVKDDYNVQGIYVSGNTYRTHPIQIFLEPQISFEDQILLKKYVNFILESFRKKLDSEFLTTYKYSNAEYTRKYLGLTQVRGLIETFPFKQAQEEKDLFLKLIENNEENELFFMLKD
ncbi:MAG: N-6 DNA methylase [Promethearchaeota archaeon]